jgi:tubulin-specific chaperone A
VKPDSIEAILDDRREIEDGDKSVLIVRSDPVMVKRILDLARERGFKEIVAADGETALQLADYYRPTAIMLDLQLPGLDGLTTVARLKENLRTRHIPIHVMSDQRSQWEAMKMGAVGVLSKPVSLDQVTGVFEQVESLVSKPVKRLLLVEDDQETRDSVVSLIGEKDVQITAVSSGEEALKKLAEGDFSCMVLDLGLPDMSGIELLEKVRQDDQDGHIPIVVFTGKELTREERLTLDRYAERVVIKGPRSPELLLDETALFLHRVEEDLPEDKREMIRLLHDKEAIFKGRKVLLIDDDARSLFAIGRVLEEKGLQIMMARTGEQGLEYLDQHPDVGLVVLDVMMPMMDGFEVMERIRAQERFKQLPIIALTAKAMKGDRARCIEAGANDYLSKPVEPDRMLSMLRVWLYR